MSNSSVTNHTVPAAADDVPFSLSVDNPVVQQWIFYSSILIIKMILMSLLTALRRATTGAFASTEDAKFFSRGQEEQPKVDQKVERVRRAHLNDIENIPIFILVSGLYLLTGPTLAAMGAQMKVYTVARIVHTLVYAFREVPQPVRAIVFVVGLAITVYMACSVLYHFF